jgi:adenylate cyclase
MSLPASFSSPNPGRYGLLMSDLRGFTAITSQVPILKLVPLLNHFFQQMSSVIDSYGGVIDKFMGDSVLALFPIHDEADTAMAMIECAIDMQVAMDEVNVFGNALGLPTLYMGIGINMGTIITCTLGSDIYRERTVLGEPVNLVARMASFALRGQVLISDTIINHTRANIDTGSCYTVSIKGLKIPMEVYEVQSMHAPTNKHVPQRENRRSPRVEVVLPISYYHVEHKKMRLPIVKADLLDLSYGGMRILTPLQHRTMDEIKIEMSVGLGQHGSGELYAKVLKCIEQDGMYCLSTEFSYVDEPVHKAIRGLVDHLA